MKLADRMAQIQPSPTLAINTKAKALRAAGVDVISFGVGEPDFDTPAHICQAAAEAIKEGFTRYTPVGGIEQLKDAISDEIQNGYGLMYGRDEIVVSCGAKHSLYNLAQVLFDPGDEVLIPAWTWYADYDAIVVGDNVFRRLRPEADTPGEQRRTTIAVVFDATSEVLRAIFFATLIIAVVFRPIFFLPGMEGRRLRRLGLSI